jgi:tetratricopeptide (TPR) repeat protein
MKENLVSWVIGWLIFAGVFAMVGWLGFRYLKRSDAPRELVRKWSFSAALIGLIVLVLAPLAMRNPFFGVGLTVLAGIGLGALWAPSLGDLLVKPIVGAWLGGLENRQSRPLYSLAEAKIKMGRYPEAIDEIHKELEKFPQDFQGHMLLAEIYAAHLKDFPGAQATVEALLSQPGHAPANVAFALNRLADWQLRFAHDPNAARASLTRIIELIPGTEQAYYAGQRLSHLEAGTEVFDPHQTKRIVVQPGPQYPALQDDFDGLKPPPENVEAVLAGYIQQLEAQPQDNEAREKLAIFYATKYGRMDLAADQLEQLIAQPGAPKKQIAHWLDLLADLHIKATEDMESARLALQRIIDRYPESALAEMARNRRSLLGLELKAKKKGQSVRLGAYEQNMGLRSGRPKPPR